MSGCTERRRRARRPASDRSELTPMADARPDRLRLVAQTTRALVYLPTVETVDEIAVEELPAFITELAALQQRAAMRLRRDTSPPIEDDRLLTIDQAAARLAGRKDWLRRRAELPFVV